MGIEQAWEKHNSVPFHLRELHYFILTQDWQLTITWIQEPSPNVHSSQRKIYTDPNPVPTEDGSNISSGTHWSNHLSDAVQEKLKKKKVKGVFKTGWGSIALSVIKIQNRKILATNSSVQGECKHSEVEGTVNSKLFSYEQNK